MRRKQQVESELLTLFLAEGFVDCTLDEMAARLSCSKATLYSIAPDRASIIRHEIGIFFRDAAERANDVVTQTDAAPEALRAYLHQIADDLRPASSAFLTDLRTYEPARSLYELNTRIAAERVKLLIERGRQSGEFRPTNAAFIGEVATSVIDKIQQGVLAESTGLSDADAFDALADLILFGVSTAPAGVTLFGG